MSSLRNASSDGTPLHGPIPIGSVKGDRPVHVLDDDADVVELVKDLVSHGKWSLRVHLSGVSGGSVVERLSGQGVPLDARPGLDARQQPLSVVVIRPGVEEQRVDRVDSAQAFGVVIEVALTFLGRRRGRAPTPLLAAAR